MSSLLRRLLGASEDLEAMDDGRFVDLAYRILLGREGKLGQSQGRKELQEKRQVHRPEKGEGRHPPEENGEDGKHEGRTPHHSHDLRRQFVQDPALPVARAWPTLSTSWSVV